MDTNTLLNLYNKYCEMANQCDKAGKQIDAARYYREALKYSSELLSSPNTAPIIKSTLRQRVLEISSYISAVENPSPKAESKRNQTVESPTTDDESPWFESKIPAHRLDKIMGMEAVKKQFHRIINRINDPDLFEMYRDPVDPTILLYGPPGTGKTFCVKCLAGELGCKYALVHSSKILDMYVGVAEQRIDKIFEEAEKYDRCLIFFDEIDALASDRDSDAARHTQSILTTLLVKLDGFMESNPNKLKIIVAATNKPWKLDKALLRGGRFDAKILVDLPDREAILGIVEQAFKMKNGKYPPTSVEPQVLFNQIADYLDGKMFGGGDIGAICGQIAENAYDEACANKESGLDHPIKRITFGDCKVVIDSYRPSVTIEELQRYRNYSSKKD